MIGKLVATSLLVLGIGAGVHAVAYTGPDRPGDSNRYFSGTVTRTASYYYNKPEFGLSVEVDGMEHGIADVAVLKRDNCGEIVDYGDWASGELMLNHESVARLESDAARLLPVGTHVEGYIANANDTGSSDWYFLNSIKEGDGDTPYSYLHVDTLSNPSVSAELVATGWGKSATDGLDLDDEGVRIEHEAVVLSSKRLMQNANRICRKVNRNYERDTRREERHARHIAALERAANLAESERREAQAEEWEAESERLYGHSSDGSDDSTGGTPNYCPPGGCR